jgi:hypothetical protein
MPNPSPFEVRAAHRLPVGCPQAAAKKIIEHKSQFCFFIFVIQAVKVLCKTKYCMYNP